MFNIFLHVLIFPITCLFFSCAALASEVETSQNKVRFDKFGIELSLPSRWELAPDVREKNIIKDFGDMIGKALDTREAAHIKLYAKESAEKPIDTWMHEDVIPSRLNMYSSKKSYIITRKSNKAVSSSGRKYDIEYCSLTIIKKKTTEKREVAFVYFPHNQYYFHLFIYNRFAKHVDKGRRSDITKEVEEIIVPGINLISGTE